VHCLRQFALNVNKYQSRILGCDHSFSASLLKIYQIISKFSGKSKGLERQVYLNFACKVQVKKWQRLLDPACRCLFLNNYPKIVKESIYSSKTDSLRHLPTRIHLSRRSSECRRSFPDLLSLPPVTK
jgi:hypothetical protein